MTEKLLDIIKSKVFEIILTIVSSSVIVYVVSRFFIKSYLNIIDYNGIAYSALVSKNTVSLYTFGIMSVFFTLFLFIVIVPSLLRLIYSKTVRYFSGFNQIYLNTWMVLGFLAPIIIFFCIVQFNSSIHLYWLGSIFPLGLYCYGAAKNNQESFFDSLITLMPQALIFTSTMLVLVIPFYFIIFFMFQSDIEYDYFGKDATIWIVISFLWVFYSVIYGVRITNYDKSNIWLDIGFSMLIICILFFLSPKAFVVSTAEFVGLKDKSPNFYKLSSDDFLKVNEKITDFWDIENIQTKSNNNSEKTYLLLFIKNRNDYYLNAQVIYRDEKHAIICPPLFNVINDDKSKCFTLNSDILLSTGKNAKFLDGLQHVTDKKWMPIHQTNTKNSN